MMLNIFVIIYDSLISQIQNIYLAMPYPSS